jgi:glycosyltransferase involved in cell wall biosynthesis
VLCAASESTVGIESIDGISVYRLPTSITIANTNVTPSLPVALARQIQDIDIIHTHLPTPWSADISALLGAVTGTPTVLTYHNDIIGEGLVDIIARIYNLTVLKLTLRLVDRILVTRDGYVQDSAYLRPFESKIQTIHNGVDINRFSPTGKIKNIKQTYGINPNRPTLFFLSVLDEFHEYKGLEELLEAVELLSNRDDDAPQLIIGGGGPYKKKYEEKSRELGIDNLVTFIGYVPEGDLPGLYRSADAFVLPSRSSTQEGFGLVALEALASGTPVITTSVVGVADEIERVGCGAVVPPGDVTTLANTIPEVLTGNMNVDEGRQLCVDQYSWADTVNNLIEVYDSVLN